MLDPRLRLGAGCRRPWQGGRGRSITPVGRILVVIPVYGEHALTHALLDDLRGEAEPLDVTVVDNRGDYSQHAGETVLRPERNLGWAGGTNYGTSETMSSHHTAVVWLNNDTRLSSGFIGGLIRSWQETGAGLVGPFYDCYWNHQRPPHPVDVAAYRAQDRHFTAQFVDGVCMFVPSETLDAVGMLDAETFAPVGYGADFDYGLRVLSAGESVVVTGLSYLHHEKSVTAKAMFGEGLAEYGTHGDSVMVAGMAAKWGEDWWRLAGIDPATKQTSPPSWRRRHPSGPLSVFNRISASRRHSRLSLGRQLAIRLREVEASNGMSVLMRRLRRAGAWAAPHGLMAPRRERQEAERRQQEAEREAERVAAAVVKAQADRQQLLRSVPLPTEAAMPFNFEAAVAFLVENGVSEVQVREGSIPSASLDFISKTLTEHLPQRPLLGLHVGNFVGVSLAHLTATMREIDEDALVVSIDPGMPHRGIHAPDRLALGLLDRFGLTAHNLLVTGFSLGRNVRDDGYVFAEDALLAATPPSVAATALREDAACEQVLPNLARLLPDRFDVAFIDGNHDGDYLREELRHIDVALRPDGMLIVDDIGTAFWGGVKAAFEDLSTEGGGYTQLGSDGRVGVVARTT